MRYKEEEIQHKKEINDYLQNDYEQKSQNTGGTPHAEGKQIRMEQCDSKDRKSEAVLAKISAVSSF